MKLIKDFASWLIFQTPILFCAYEMLQGVKWAANLVLFYGWFIFVAGCVILAAPAKEPKERSYVPNILKTLASLALLGALIASGHFATAVAFSLGWLFIVVAHQRDQEFAAEKAKAEAVPA
jgi:hypothetical protein